MSKNNLKIVFFGSGEIANQTLKYLKNHFFIEAVITKKSTQAYLPTLLPGTKIFTADNKDELNKIFENNNFSSKLGVLVDYGVILDQKILEVFPKGIVNSHFSLLPEWRGADPIVFSLLSGQDKTGVSLMLIDRGIDTGKLLAQKSVPIEAREDIFSLNNKLINLSNELLAKYLPMYVAGKLPLRNQSQSVEPTYSRKLKKSDGDINWSKTAEEIEREIRAYKKWPKSRTKLAGKDVIITDATLINDSGTPGQTVAYDKKIKVFCGKNALLINKLKPAGKKEMTSEAFLAGYKI